MRECIITTSPKKRTFSVFLPLSIKNMYTSLKWRPPILYRSVTLDISCSCDVRCSSGCCRFSRITLIVPSIASADRSSLKNPTASAIS